MVERGGCDGYSTVRIRFIVDEPVTDYAEIGQCVDLTQLSYERLYCILIAYLQVVPLMLPALYIHHSTLSSALSDICTAGKCSVAGRTSGTHTRRWSSLDNRFFTETGDFMWGRSTTSAAS